MVLSIWDFLHNMLRSLLYQTIITHMPLTTSRHLHQHEARPDKAQSVRHLLVVPRYTMMTLLQLLQVGASRK